MFSELFCTLKKKIHNIITSRKSYKRIIQEDKSLQRNKEDPSIEFPTPFLALSHLTGHTLYLFLKNCHKPAVELMLTWAELHVWSVGLLSLKLISSVLFFFPSLGFVKVLLSNATCYEPFHKAQMITFIQTFLRPAK